MSYKSILIARYGGPEVMQIVENDLRPPTAGEVRIKVLAATVSRPDMTERRGEALYTGTPLAEKLPFTPSYAVIGDVDAVGANVSLAAKFPILEAASANEYLESGKVTGNIVLLAPEFI